jgi:hypothetical protein
MSITEPGRDLERENEFLCIINKRNLSLIHRDGRHERKRK